MTGAEARKSRPRSTLFTDALCETISLAAQNLEIERSRPSFSHSTANSSHMRYDVSHTAMDFFVRKESAMATNVELDDELVARAMALSPARSKRALLEEALKTYIRVQEQKEVRDLRGRLRWENPK